MDKTDEEKLSLSTLEDEVKKLIRRVDTMQKSVDLLYQDRSILEDMQGSIRGLQEIMLHNREHNASAINDVKNEVKESQIAVEQKLTEVQTTVGEGVSVLAKEIVKPKVNRSLWQSIQGLWPFSTKGVKK